MLNANSDSINRAKLREFELKIEAHRLSLSYASVSDTCNRIYAITEYIIITLC